MKKSYLIGLVLLGSLGTFAGVLGHNNKVQASPQPIAQAKQDATCFDLLEVVTGQTEIRKQIRIGLWGLRSGNIHTDFAVPPSGDIDFFEVTFVPENNATYDAQINLRFPDGSQATAFQASGPVEIGNTYSRRFVSPTGERPFLINTSISGENNTAYTIGVQACEN